MNLSDYRIKGAAIEFVESSHVDRLAKRVESLSLLCVVLLTALLCSLASHETSCSASYSATDRAQMDTLVLKFAGTE